MTGRIVVPPRAVTSITHSSRAWSRVRGRAKVRPVPAAPAVPTVKVKTVNMTMTMNWMACHSLSVVTDTQSFPNVFSTMFMKSMTNL